jgi:hypothetical protein
VYTHTNTAQVALLLVYLLDILLKLVVYGAHTFWEHLQFRFEAAISLASTTVAVYSIAAPDVDTAPGNAATL